MEIIGTFILGLLIGIMIGFVIGALVVLKDIANAWKMVEEMGGKGHDNLH